MELFENLPPADKEYHISVARKLIAGKDYAFSPPIRIGEAEIVSGRFIRWRVEGRSLLRDCLFLVEDNPESSPDVSSTEQMVSILFRCGVKVSSLRSGA